MKKKVTDLNAYREAKEDECLGEIEAAEQDLQLTAIRHTDHLIDSLTDEYGVTPAFVAEAIMMGLLGRASFTIKNTDDRAFCDFLNYANESSQAAMTDLDCARGRDDELRLEWRSQVYAHRLPDEEQ